MVSSRRSSSNNIIEGGSVHPCDSLPGNERLSVAAREVRWPRHVVLYPSPVETEGHDEITDLTPDEFFDGMPTIAGPSEA